MIFDLKSRENESVSETGDDRVQNECCFMYETIT